MAHQQPRAADITPDTRVGELLERWPQLEDVLVALSPHFRALRNPVLRRTVAKIATLRQASSVAAIPLATLIGALREAAGLAPVAVSDSETAAPGQRPPWAAEEATTRRRDAREAIEAGEHPLPDVMEDLAKLNETDVYELVTPFVPAPLIEVARAKGFVSFSASEGEALVRTWFRRSAPLT